MNMRKGIARY